MEKGEHDFRYKVDQVQETLSDAHKAHLRQVSPYTFAFRGSSSALWGSSSALSAPSPPFSMFNLPCENDACFQWAPCALCE